MSRFVLLIAAIAIVLMRSHQCDALPTAASAVKYLQRYGYLKSPDSRAESQLSDEKISKGLRLFQSFFGLPETGTLDLATMAEMDKPRCGVPDIIDVKSSNRTRRYVLEGSKWSTKKISYNVKKYSKRVTKEEVDSAFTKAWDSWAKVSSLWFKSVEPEEKADITLTFERRAHGDGHPFHGPYLVLAHAFPPFAGGAVHFDDDEPWVVDEEIFSDLQIGLQNVAAHEFGHSLGIAHTRDKKALMYPTYDEDIKTPQEDDINAIEKLYGKNAGVPNPLDGKDVNETLKEPNTSSGRVQNADVESSRKESASSASSIVGTYFLQIATSLILSAFSVMY